MDSLYEIAGQQYLLVGVQRYLKDREHYTALIRMTASPGSRWIEYDDAIVDDNVDSAGVFRQGVPHCLFFRRMRGSSVGDFIAAAKELKSQPRSRRRSGQSQSQ